MQRLEREKYLAGDELARLLQAARQRAHRNSARDHALLALLASTGIRPGEALALRVRDFKLTDHDPTVRVRRLKKRTALGQLDDLPLARSLARTLRSYLAGAAAGHHTNLDDRAFPIGIRSAERMFLYYARRAGLDPHFRLYCLRHTAGTRAWAATRDLRLVQTLLGHAHPNTTAIYTHVDPERVRELSEEIVATGGR